MSIVILLLFVVVATAAVWYFGYRSHRGRSVLHSVSTAGTATELLPTGSIQDTGTRKIYVYPGGYFQFSYPSNWTISPIPIYNTTPFSTEVNIIPPNAPATYAGGTEAVTVRAYQSIDLANAAAQFETTSTPVQSEYLMIGGYRAIFQQYAQSPSLNNETYRDDIYAVTMGNMTVVFYFRVTESAMKASAGLAVAASFNETNLLPAFNAMVASLKFN